MNARMLLLGVTVASGILLAAVLGVAHATPPAGQVTEMLARGTATDELVLRVQGRFPNAKAGPWRGTYRTPWDVTTLRITLPPGGHTGWHRHPGPGFMTVVSGSVTVYANDCSRSTYTRGQSYVCLLYTSPSPRD